MKIEIINENLNSYRISKDFEIEVIPEEGEESIVLEFNKWYYEDDSNINNSTDFTEESQKIFDELPEEQQDEINDFISEIKL